MKVGDRVVANAAGKSNGCEYGIGDEGTVVAGHPYGLEIVLSDGRDLRHVIASKWDIKAAEAAAEGEDDE